MRRALILAGVALVLFLPACASDDDGGGSTDEAGSPTSAVPEDTEPPPTLPEDVTLPIVFVHGFAGSAQQYESQAMRFVANGYPQDRILAYDHDGAGTDIAGYADGLDDVVDGALAEFGTEQVYLVGHSRGTFVSSTYLADPERSAKVARVHRPRRGALPGRPGRPRVPGPDPGDAAGPVPRRGGDLG